MSTRMKRKNVLKSERVRGWEREREREKERGGREGKKDRKGGGRQ